MPAKLIFCFLLTFFLMFACRKAYNPPAIQGNNHYLAVDGFINTGSNSVTTFIITRSRNLADTVPTIPELNAQVFVQGANGSSYPLQDNNNTGVYTSFNLSLDSTITYQLAVNTSDGNKYISDFVPSKSCPPIDSISWQLIYDPVTALQAVKLFANTHDPQNNTHYYRWDYIETYEHLSFLQSNWGVKDGLIYLVTDTTGSTHTCWSTDSSSNILLGTSIALTQDVISQGLLAYYGQNDPKLDQGLSVLVKQYPLTSDGFKYWITVQKNSQSLGGLFDLQPSQISGNFHCTTNPSNPALGFISASSMQEQRIYISNKSLPGWASNPINNTCKTNTIEQDSDNTLIYNYPDTSYGPYSFVGSGPVFLIVAPKSCLDCRYNGGTIEKPSFWPNE